MTSAGKPVRCEVSAEDHTWCLTHNCKVTDPQHPRDFEGYVRRTDNHT